MYTKNPRKRLLDASLIVAVLSVLVLALIGL